MPRSFVEAVRGKYVHVEGSQEGGELVGGDKTGKKQALNVLRNVFVPGESIDSAGGDGEIASLCGAIRELDLGNNPLGSWQPVQAIATQLPHLGSLTLDKVALAPLDAVPVGFASAFGKLSMLCLNDTGMAWGQLLLLAASMPALAEVHFASNKVTSLQPPTGGADVGASLGGVHSLYLEDNLIESWEAVAPVANLPKLTLLNLNYNRLSTVPPHSTAATAAATAAADAATDSATGFATLKHLMLRANPIDAWATIDALDTFPALAEARLTELPLIKDASGAVARRTIIARMGKLVALNGSEVRVREREDAERFYLRAVAQEYPEGGLPKDAVIEKGGGDAAAATDISDADAAKEPPAVDEYGRPLQKPAAAPAAVDEYGRPLQKAGGAAGAVDEYGRPLQKAGGAAGAGAAPAAEIELRVPATPEWNQLQRTHPRWASLLTKHGTHASLSGGSKASGGVIANELVEVTMRSLVAESAHLPACTRKLPGGLPLKSVRLIACQLYKVEPSKVMLLYAPPGQENDIPEELDDDAKSLADMGVVRGGSIVIDEKPTM